MLAVPSTCLLVAHCSTCEPCTTDQLTNLVEEEKDATSSLAQFAKTVQDVLYSVAEGFEVPQDVNQENEAPAAEVDAIY